MLRNRARIAGENAVELLAEEARQFAHPLETREDLDPLMDRIGDAHFVLLGEASHGAYEFYQWRARLSSRLIAEKGFRFVAVEGDWPDCYRVNRYVKGYPDAGKNAPEVLRGSVIAGQSWEAPMERMNIPEGRTGSWDDGLHQAGRSQLLLFEPEKLSDEFQRVRNHRAIGVVYDPESESRGNQVPTVLPKRYDAFLHIDETEALHPLHIEPDKINPPDLYPWGV